MSRRAGTSLVELLIGLTLTALLCGLVAGPFIAAERWARQQADRLAVAEALRIPMLAMGTELRWLDPGEDIAAIGGDSLALRAFRGSAVVCAVEDGRAVVRYRGARQPNPEKDSVLVVAGGGAGARAGLGSTTPVPGACAVQRGETAHRWTVDLPLATGEFVLLFEHGSYHLADRALRFRRGLAGRQPLTAERLGSTSALEGIDAHGHPTDRPGALVAVDVRLVPRRRPTGGGLGETPPQSTAARLPLLNRPLPPAGGGGGEADAS